MLAYIHEQINGRVPLVGVGDVRTSEDAEQVLENSELVAVGRALLIDPHWGAKALDKKDDLIRQEISNYDREELFLANGVWGFMEFMMPDRLGK